MTTPVPPEREPPQASPGADPASDPSDAAAARPSRHRGWWTPAGVSAMAGVAAVVVAGISVLVSLPRDDGSATTGPETASGDRVFVYGSSMPGQSRYAEIAEYVQSSTRATVDGLLYDSGLGYPAAKFEPGGEIPGFVLTLDPATADAFMREQTALESGLFAPVPVQTHTGQAATAWEWIGATDGLPRIDAWDGSTAHYGQSVEIRTLPVGACFSNSDGSTALTTWCEAPHGFEALHVESLPPGPYSVDSMEAVTAERCESAFVDVIGKRPEDTEFAIERFLPTTEQWESGDRVVACAVVHPGSLLTGALVE